MLTADLVAYQDTDYANRFLDAVSAAAAAERRVAPSSNVLTEAVARHLYRLMAYKDEYEVARLLLLPEARLAAEAVGGADPTVTWMLHPPMMKSLGRAAKLGFPDRTAVGFAALARGKRLRGTRLDPFGFTSMRRLERELPVQYLAAMETVYRHLTADNIAAATAIAELPDLVRGFEELKIERIATYRQRLTTAVADFTSS